MIGAVKRLKVTDYFKKRSRTRATLRRKLSSPAIRLQERDSARTQNTPADKAGVFRQSYSQDLDPGHLESFEVLFGLREITAPVVSSGDREHGLELHFIIHLEGDGLRSVAAALAMIIFKFVPVGAGFAGSCVGRGLHGE